jgi:hypothetical protein|tara:strand:- start:472 stop:813 length:342 start_codon:yes stop_codon:yes gene_type:complete
MGIEKIKNIEEILIYDNLCFKNCEEINDSNPVLVSRKFDDKEYFVAVRGYYNLVNEHRSGKKSVEAYVFRDEDIGFRDAANFMYHGKKAKSLVLSYIKALDSKFENLKKIKDC